MLLPDTYYTETAATINRSSATILILIFFSTVSLDLFTFGLPVYLVKLLMCVVRKERPIMYFKEIFIDWFVICKNNTTRYFYTASKYRIKSRKIKILYYFRRAKRLFSVERKIARDYMVKGYY